MSLLAVDMGSSSCKAVAFSAEGCALAHNTQSYTVESPHPSWSEMSPAEFWRAFVTAIRAVAMQVGDDPVEALAISSHGETFIPVDAQWRPIAPAILNADNRAGAEAKWLADQIGPGPILDITGLSPHPMYPLPKILWLRKNQPDVFLGATCFLTLPGYLLTRLGMPAYVDHSLASRFLMFDIRKRRWSDEILSACALPIEKFPTPVPAGTIAGDLSKATASDLGLNSGTPVVLGGHDQPCAALGSGVLGPGRVSGSLGTYECLVAASAAPALRDVALAANLNSYCHVVPDRFVTLAYFPSGIAIEWFVRLFHAAQGSPASASLNELCEELERRATPEPTGLCVTPHLLGSCNPDFDPNATGVITGIRPHTTRADLYKGILEGIACEFAAMVDLLQQATGPFEDVYISGGGGRSRLGLQLRAALANVTLHRMQCSEAVCLGTSILAGVAIGKFKTPASTVEKVVRDSETIPPDPAMAAQYAAQKMQYSTLYSSLAPFRSGLARLN